MFIQVFLFDAVVPGSDLSFAARDCFAAKDRQSTHRVLDGTHTQLQLHHDDRLGMATTPEPPATGNGRPARGSTPRRYNKPKSKEESRSDANTTRQIKRLILAEKTSEGMKRHYATRTK